MKIVRAGACWVVAGLLVLGAGREAAAQGVGVVTLPRLQGPVELDGRVDEAAWTAVPPLPLTMYLPTFQGAPSEASEIRVAHDGENLWVAGRFYDGDPEGIRVNSLYRDRWSGDDALGIFVDPFNDNENGLWFTTTPGGVRVDLSISDDGTTSNASWNTYWDVKTTIDDEGWFVEVRIPFSSLGFQTEDGRVVMGLAVTRLTSRKNERVTFPAIDPRYQFRQPSVYQDVELTGVEVHRPVYVTPYGLAGSSSEPSLVDREWTSRRSQSYEGGFDAKVNLSGTVTLDLTVRPDFAQVEADQQQINLTRFSLFFPEKRPFFQERSGIFDFSMGDAGKLFHSRRIGLSEDRQPVPIPAGARLVGRMGQWDVGLLEMATESENFAVGRFRRRVLNPYSTVGAMVTSRTGITNQTSIGLDGVFRLFGDEYLTARGAWADPSGADPSFGGMPDAGVADASALQIEWARRSQRGLNYNAHFVRTGGAYDPGMGYLQRPAFTRVGGYIQYFWFQDDASRLRYLLPGFVVNTWTRAGDGSLESATIRHWWTVEWKSGASGWIEPEWFLEDVREPFLLAKDVRVEPGRYSFADLWLNYAMPAGRLLRAGIDAKVGAFYGGRRVQLTVSPTWHLSERLELGGSWQSNFIRFPDQGTSLNTHLALLRVNTALSTAASANAFVQYNSTAGTLAGNVRLRYNFREGNDLWLVVNQGVFVDRDLFAPDAPRLPRVGARTILLKYTHTLAF